MKRFEKRHDKLLPLPRFFGRLALFMGVAVAVLGLSLYGGMAGFHYLEHLSWLDSLLNATMLLGGEGPIEQPATMAGKVFASFYAVYSGVVFLIAFGILITPVVHRVLHHFHLPEDEDGGPKGSASRKGKGPSRRRKA